MTCINGVSLSSGTPFARAARLHSSSGAPVVSRDDTICRIPSSGRALRWKPGWMISICEPTAPGPITQMRMVGYRPIRLRFVARRDAAARAGSAVDRADIPACLPACGTSAPTRGQGRRGGCEGASRRRTRGSPLRERMPLLGTEGGMRGGGPSGVEILRRARKAHRGFPDDGEGSLA
jgi:hypothetical protein